MKNIKQKEENKTITYDHVKVVPDEQIALHHQGTWELSYIIEGCGTRVLGDTEESFSAGEIVLVVPEMPHQWIFDPKGVDKHGRIENITVCFPSNMLKQLSAIFPEYKDLSDWYDKLGMSIKLSNSDSISNKLLHMEHESQEQRITSLLSILSLIHYSNKIQEAGHFVSSQDRVEKIKAWLRCNYQREVSLDQLSKYVGMNKSSMCTYFKQQTGETIFGFLTYIRIEVAKHLLEDHKMTITSCCYSSGFNDVPYFSRVFKRMTGMSPMQYKRQKTG